jgi:Cyclin M transmembrane N-terminal domain
MKKLLPFLQMVAGWCVISAAIYIFVYKQAYLISSVGKLLSVVVIGVLAGFFFSLLEAALLSIGSTEEKDVLQAAEQNVRKKDLRQISEAEYKSKKQRYDRYVDIYANKVRHIPPLIMLSNLSNLFTASLVPVALSRQTTITNIQLDIAQLQTFFNLPVKPIEIPGSMATLTFFSSAIFILIFAKIAPKQIGSQQERRAGIVMTNSRLILLFSLLLGWLGTAVNAPIDLFLKRK